ncbi:MAG: hypothetical protein RL846_27470, partial [Deltaproteobacteria bacterium]
MLDERGIEYRYREYTQEPLDAAEVKRVLKKLGLGPKDVLRKNDKAYKELGLTGDESDAELTRNYGTVQELYAKIYERLQFAELQYDLEKTQAAARYDIISPVS